MLYLIYLLVFASTIILFSSIYPYFHHRRPLPIMDTSEDNSIISRLHKRPFLFKLVIFLNPLNKLLVNRLGRKKLENKLISANVGFWPEDFLVIKELLLTVSMMVLFVFKDLFGGKDLLFFAIFLALSLIGPDIWLNMRISKRKKMIVNVLPDIVDLLSLCVNAGMDFSVAVKWIVEKSKPNPLNDDLSLFLLETKIGKPRKQALQDMAKRINLPEMYFFSHTIAQAERLGTPVETALSILAEEGRDLRFRNGERLALQAPIKMLFPLIFFIMPVVGVIVGGPVLLQFMGANLPKF